jgi:hypothetical protein
VQPDGAIILNALFYNSTGIVKGKKWDTGPLPGADDNEIRMEYQEWQLKEFT